jgi:hypothetical protein
VWEIVEPLLIKFALQEVVQILVKAGVISALTGSLIKTAEDLKLAVSDVKLYRQFPGDIVAPTNTSNLQVSQPPA